MRDLFIKLFFIDALAELFSPVLFPSFPEIRYVTKPLLLILLMGHIAQENPKPALFFTAFFALLGDVFLLIPENNPLYFQLGLGSFLIMQLSYIRLFAKQTREGVVSCLRSPALSWSIYLCVLILSLFKSACSRRDEDSGNLVCNCAGFHVVLCNTLAKSNHRLGSVFICGI
jgi:uncharacterized membrane protein YhhN